MVLADRGADVDFSYGHGLRVDMGFCHVFDGICQILRRGLCRHVCADPGFGVCQILRWELYGYVCTGPG